MVYGSSLDMAKGKTVYSVTTPRGVFARTSARTYTHVVIGVTAPGYYRAGEWGVIGFAGRLELAIATASTWARKGCFAAIEIYAIDGSSVAFGGNGGAL